MAYTPAELMTKLTSADVEHLDQLENRIDSDMVARYEGGNFTYMSPKKINGRVADGLRKRYSGWFLVFKSGQAAGPNEYEYPIEFQPNPDAVVMAPLTDAHREELERMLKNPLHQRPWGQPHPMVPFANPYISTSAPFGAAVSMSENEPLVSNRGD